MKKGRKERRTSVFIRYALSYTLVVILLFTGITAYLFRKTEQQVLEETVTAQVNRLSRIALLHESYISAMLSTAEEIGLSPHIEPFRYGEEPWKAYDLQLQLVPYTSANGFCDQMYLLFSEDDRMYASYASMTVDRFTRLTRYESVSAEELSRLLRETDRLTILPAQRITSPLMDGTSSEMVSVLLPLGANPGTRKGTMLFLIKKQVYEAMFDDAIEQPMNTYIFQGDALIAGTEELELPREEATARAEAGPSRIFSRDGVRWMTVALNDRSWGMRYVTAMRMEDVSSAVRLSMGRLLSMLALLLALALVLILWTSGRHARPIEELSNLLPRSAADPRRDELTRISTGIRQLTSRLEQSLPLQRHDFIFRFVKGRFASREAAASAALAVGMHLEGKDCYAVILCSIPEEEDQPFELTQPPFSALKDVTGAGAELVAMKANLYLAFAGEAGPLRRLAELLRERGGGCITAISAVHRAWEEAPEAYLEAAAAYENRFVMGRQQVLAYDEMSPDVRDILPKAQKITNAIDQAITVRNRDMLNDRIGELLQFLRNTSMSPFAFRTIYNDVINRLVRARSPELAETREFYDIFHLSSCRSIDDLEEMLRGLCDTLMDEEPEAPREEAPAEDEMQQAARYMEEHFSEPEISMAAIAESFGLSTARLSMRFRESLGMTPSDYLTMLRCNRAKELLETTELTIREISGQVGYYDPGSFIRRFKQVVGETPQQYRLARAEAERETKNAPGQGA